MSRQLVEVRRRCFHKALVQETEYRGSWEDSKLASRKMILQKADVKTGLAALCRKKVDGDPYSSMCYLL
ncbi:hypothetical protein F2P81_020530 [Scophthalmus maximus]|uniref:Uncharacterized protein n=1 Tax=Scophthalmus maximus TaxID=52904 RepID=A0A6A4S5F8_SCOMX|nr:hypothetical protein F2P81_020530 [Scophthalmus maximus]